MRAELLKKRQKVRRIVKNTPLKPPAQRFHQLFTNHEILTTFFLLASEWGITNDPRTKALAYVVLASRITPNVVHLASPRLPRQPLDKVNKLRRCSHHKQLLTWPFSGFEKPHR